MLTENFPAGWEKEEKAEDMKGAISARELPRDGLKRWTYGANPSQQKEGPQSHKNRLRRVVPGKSKSNKIVYHLIPLLALVIYLI